MPAPAAACGHAVAGASAARRRDFADLDFLADASAVLVNLVPDKDGVVKFAARTSGRTRMIHVVAVDPLNTTTRSVAWPKPPASSSTCGCAMGSTPKGTSRSRSR